MKRKFKDLKNLDGFEKAEAYAAELSHGLMGFFPLLITDLDVPVVALEKNVLQAALKTVKPREFRTIKINMIVKKDEDFGFITDRDDGEEIHILSPEGLKDMKSDDPFSWASGLLSFKAEPTKEQYEEMIDGIT